MMTKADTARLLTMIAAFDRRTLGEPDVDAWHLIVADLDPADCAQAVKDHYTESRVFLMPVDVHSRAKVYERQRVGRERVAVLESQRLADEERDRLAIAAAPAPVVGREQLRARLAALAARGPGSVPRVDPRPDGVRLAEARREVAQVAAAAASRDKENANG